MIFRFSTLLFALASMPAVSASAFVIEGSAGTRLEGEVLSDFNEPWAMTFLPDGKLLVTEKSGKLMLLDSNGSGKTEVSNVPDVDYGGQGGLGDIVLHPDFAANNIIYLSFAEAGQSNTRGAAVVRAKLVQAADSPKLEEVKIIWRQFPKVSGRGHYSHRMAFSPDGKLFISSGDRQKLDPAQDMASSLGKIIRLNDDGSVPSDNPFQDQGDLAKTFWSLGHRNLLGIAFDASGQLWQNEMGPRHGDELNKSVKGANYGWPLVSEGKHYSGEAIPSHETNTAFEPPKTFWVPSIAPSSLVIYNGDIFPEWNGNALIGGLVGEAMILVKLTANEAAETERYSWGNRVREVEEAPDGSVLVLEDGTGGRLIRLTPAG